MRKKCAPLTKKIGIRICEKRSLKNKEGTSHWLGSLRGRVSWMNIQRNSLSLNVPIKGDVMLFLRVWSITIQAEMNFCDYHYWTWEQSKHDLDFDTTKITWPNPPFDNCFFAIQPLMVTLESRELRSAILLPSFSTCPGDFSLKGRTTEEPRPTGREERQRMIAWTWNRTLKDSDLRILDTAPVLSISQKI